MMLPERTSSAHVARAFQRFARGAVVGLALGVLAACGGGGGSSTPAKTTPTPTPEMTITPVQALTAAQLEAATVISAGETVNGTLESADDVKYYRLDVAETSVVELTLDAEAGTEVALMHRNGVVLTGGITASEITPTGVVVPGGGPPLYVRVREKVGQLEEAAPAVVRKVRRTFSLVSKVEKVAKWAGAVINIVRGIPKVDVPIGVGEVNVDLTGVFQRSDNGGVAFRVGGSTGALAVHLSKTRIESTDEKISATVRADGSAMPGDVELTLCASPLLALVAPAPIAVGILKRTNPLACTPWTIPLVKALPRRKPGVPETSPVSFIQAGGTFTSEPVGSYFEYAEGATVRYSLAVVGGSPRTGWDSDIVDDRVRISSASDIDGGSNIVVRLTITDSTDSGTNPKTAHVDFRVEIAEPMTPAEPPDEPDQPMTPAEPTLVTPMTPASGTRGYEFCQAAVQIWRDRGYILQVGAETTPVTFEGCRTGYPCRPEDVRQDRESPLYPTINVTFCDCCGLLQ